MGSLLASGLITGLTRTLISSRFPTVQFSSMDRVIGIIRENSWTIPPQLPFHLKDYLLQLTRDIFITDDSSPDTLSWMDDSSGNLSLKAAWHLLQTRAIDLPWTGLIWNKYVNPRLACFSWRLLLRKTPTDYVGKYRGCNMASRCYNCHLCEESDIHLFFSRSLANAFWSWLLGPFSYPPPPTSAAAVWEVISDVRDVSGRKWAAAIFFQAISILRLLRNDAMHNNRKSTLQRAKLICSLKS
eukprot:TRINITY_DN9918_c0_g1_i6.p1 TRINITY_DN9918_c0_g1~~TRINITY_DN9918_c0_g1_i6.p1  ORF type:complete len:242 (-),score=35.86 TRINITY_DN9918_c0_g1_i6:234-959(-)